MMYHQEAPQQKFISKRSTHCWFTRVSILILLPLVFGAAAANQASSNPTATRIGVYDSRAIAVAYANSPQLKTKLNDLERQRDQASNAGDTKRVALLNAQGEAMQRRLHLQSFSNAPVDDLMATVQDRIAEVARSSKVVAVVASIDYRDASIEAVDITDDLVSLFAPNEQTLRMIADLRKQKPLPIEDVAPMSANR